MPKTDRFCTAQVIDAYTNCVTVLDAAEFETESGKFIFTTEKFKEEIPRYMIKHQVRPGITGWAQVNGYRGDTSIRKRIAHDVHYIENWTLGFDIKILFLTVFKGFINKNAY